MGLGATAVGWVANVIYWPSWDDDGQGARLDQTRPLLCSFAMATINSTTFPFDFNLTINPAPNGHPVLLSLPQLVELFRTIAQLGAFAYGLKA